MKTYVTITIPERKEKRLDKTTCDICGEEIKQKNFSADEIIVMRNDGYNYPEGGWGVKSFYDICLECWTNKLVPFFDSLGATSRQEEWDW